MDNTLTLNRTADDVGEQTFELLERTGQAMDALSLIVNTFTLCLPESDA